MPPPVLAAAPLAVSVITILASVRLTLDGRFASHRLARNLAVNMILLDTQFLMEEPAS